MRQLLRSVVIIFVLVPGLATLLHAGVVTVTFDFEDVAANTPTLFSDTVSGLSATFSSSPDAGGFMVASFPAGTFQTLSGNVLIDFAPESLTIAFGAPQTAISLSFAAADNQPLDLSASLLGLPVGGSSASGVPAGGFAEGALSFSTATFDTVVLSSNTPNFAIDNVAVTDPPATEAPAVPEPGSFLLCAGALAALSFVQLRRRVS